ncbi:MAG TPA: hypothetical protein VKS22_14945 [Candidatus Binataceae bacterium]|nr:hypothetical protein [Candidatus Binataceae bacterium]
MACVLVAAAAPLEALTVDPFNAIGSGTSFTTDCTPASASCSATFSGRVRASQAGNFLVSATLTINHSAGFVCIDAACTNQCFGASGTGTLNNPKGDSIAFGEAGLLCSIAPTFVPETFSGTYFIEGGTGTFANEIGSGVATASVNGSTIATVPLVLFSLNGTIGTN